MNQIFKDSSSNVFSQSLNIKGVHLKNRIFLAPLAGVSDIPFRRICQEMGAGLTFVEMLSSTALSYKNKKTLQMAERHPDEKILGVQLTGNREDHFKDGLEVLNQQNFEVIDLNMGCPVKKVVQSGCGSALLLDLEKVEKFFNLLKDTSPGKIVSTKFRLGYTRQQLIMEDVSLLAQNTGLDMITIHGRTRNERYDTPVDLHSISLAFKNLKALPHKPLTIANGDIFSFEDAMDAYKTTECDAVMVSRGALGNPWIFQEILQGTPIRPYIDEWIDVVSRHLSYQNDYYKDETLASILFRKHLVWYTTGFPGVKKFREKIGTLETQESILDYLKEISLTIPKETQRSYHVDQKSAVK